MSVAQDLLLLQGHIKRDAPGYQDEFELQWRHYQACLQLLRLSPDQPSPELAELVTFVSQVAGRYPKLSSGFAPELISVLDEHHMLLEPSLRETMVKALILLRNRNELPAAELLPLLFRLFKVQNKALRTLVFRHITADIKAANKKARNERLNRSLQAFMYSVLSDPHEGTAKRGLAVLTELWRRRIWRDARTVNVIASAAAHPSPRVLLAVLKFFVGQDAAAEAGGADSDDSDDEAGERGGDELAGPAAPSKDAIYAAFHKGTSASKKKKQRKLKRVQAAVKKAERRGAGVASESFAALQLLHDPQGFADRLFQRMQAPGTRHETRLVIMSVLSRAIGVHKLLVLNFYPFLQKYIAPQTADVTTVLAAFVQACHDQVPPDALEPALRRLVDQFVHDRARPEVMTIGLKTVREICTRTPLIMTPDLLQDLTMYKKTRDKAVSSAARGLISLFRELAPGMLERKERGRGADLDAAPLQFGAARLATGVDGLDLLEAAERAGRFDSDGELISDDEEEAGDLALLESGSDDDEGELGGDSEDEAAPEDDSEEEGLDGAGRSDDDEEGRRPRIKRKRADRGEDAADDAQASEDDEQVEGSASDDDEQVEGSASDDEGDGSQGEWASLSEGEDEQSGSEENEEEVGAAAPAPPRRPGQAGSLTQLKKQLAEARKASEAAAAPEEEAWPDRILSSQDFEKIRRLKHRQLVEKAMQKHGLQSASKREKARAAAEEAADAALALQSQLGTMHDARVAPDDLLGAHKYRKDKAERLKAVMEGREGREFGAKTSLKNKKTGGLSNKEKQKRKNLPLAARTGQMRQRKERNKLKSAKNFRGRVKK